MLQHSRQSLTSQQQRQLWQQRRRMHQTRRAMRKQRVQRQIRHRNPSNRLPLNAPPSSTSRTQSNLRKPVKRPSAPNSSTRPSAPRSRTQSTAWAWFAYLTRLAIVGSGVAAIAGTALTIIDPKPQTSVSRSPSVSTTAASINLRPPAAPLDPAQPVQPKVFDLPPEGPQSLFYRWSQEPRIKRLIREGRELLPIKRQIQQWSAAQAELKPAMFFLNPMTGEYLDINGSKSISAASTIKIPILLAFFEAVDAGTIARDEALVMRQDLVASEAGSMQYEPVGTEFSAFETAEYMIAISDNTATNMLIDRLGGAEKLNERFKAWGLKHTVIRNSLPDLEGTNTISPQDMATLMLKLKEDDLLSPTSRDQAFDILRQTVTNTLLPQGIDEDADIAHKTGDIGSVVGDVGLIDMPNGQHYVAAIMVQRPHNDPRAQELIRKISKLTYKTFRQPDSTVANPVSASDN